MSGRVATAVVIGVLVLTVFVWLGPYAMALQMEWEAKKKRGDPPDYDERQKLARQRAGNHALYVLLGFLILWVIVDQIGWFAWTGNILDMVLCALQLTWCAWSSECILNDAFATWKNKQFDGSSLALTYNSMMLMNMQTFRSGGMIESIVPFVFACGNMVVLGTVVLYKLRRDKRLEKMDAMDAGDGDE